VSEKKLIAFLGVSSELIELLLRGLKEFQFNVDSTETVGKADLVICGTMNHLVSLAGWLRRRGQLVLVVANVNPTVENLCQLANMSVSCLDADITTDISYTQLVMTVASLLARGKQDNAGPVTHLMKCMDQFGNGKNLQLVPRLSNGTLKRRTVETGFYWLHGEDGFNTKLSGGMFGTGMRFERKLSFCVSSQAGCSLAGDNACLHCLTGRGKFAGNLTWEEIVAQVEIALLDSPLIAAELLVPNRRTALHVSFMGEGEPLHNLANVMAAIRYLNSNYPRMAFSLSTVGVAEGIETLLEENLEGISLQPQLSGHYYDERRVEFIPFAVGPNELELTLPLMLKLAKKLGQRLSINTVMIGGPNGWQNNRAEDATKLIELCRPYGLGNFRLKLSPFNGEGRGLKVRFSAGAPDAFAARAQELGARVQIVKSMGTAKQAGCGSLITHILPAIR
jgi:adenine C2-methylase RlmN of 23S rRNA A2503 and tRNA A37